MTNEEKAMEISSHRTSLDYEIMAYDGALEMAKWKDQQHAKDCESLVGLAVEEARQVFIDEACEIVRDLANEYFGDWEQSCKFEDKFRNAMTKKTNPLFEQCLANVNPKTREEVRKNIEALANCDQQKVRQYSESRILALPADVNEDGEVFYLNSDLGTADDEHNGLSGEIEMAYCNGYGQALLDNKSPWHKVSEELPPVDTEVVCKMKGVPHTEHFVCKWDGKYWLHWAYFGRTIQSWCGLSDGWEVVEWKEI